MKVTLHLAIDSLADLNLVFPQLLKQVLHFPGFYPRRGKVRSLAN
jgi:hypothetical protein